MGHMLRQGKITQGPDMTDFDLGPYSRKVTTSSPEAQLWFDRGLNWLFGFNHGEAIKCFQKAGSGRRGLCHGVLGHQLRLGTKL